MKTLIYEANVRYTAGAGDQRLPSRGKVEVVAFGLFEADLQSGELWKSGHKIRLPRQPFRVLASMLSRPGEIVTREELQLEIWGTNTTVDFDQAIAAAINKIREALGDSADNPRFVQTLTKRGYRFIAPVERVPNFTDTSAVKKADELLMEPATLSVPPATRVSEQMEVTQIAPPVAPTDASLPVEGSKANGPADGPLPQTSPRLQDQSGKSSERKRAWLDRWALLSACALIVAAVVAISFAWRSSSVSGRSSAPAHVEQVTHYTPISVGPPNPESFLAMGVEGERVFTSVMVNGRPRLSSIDVNSGAVHEVAVPDEILANSLADISKDGSMLLLLSRQSSESEQPLWVVPSAGGTGRRIPGVLAHDASWMPDGVSVLFATGNELAEIRANEDAPVPFAKLPGRAFWLRWSPDGKLLRFTLFDPITHASSIWEMESKSHIPRAVKLTATDGMSACCGVWLPDDNSYVFQADDNLWQLRGLGSHHQTVQLTNGPLRSLSPAPTKSGSRIFFLGLESPSGLQQFDASESRFRSAPPFLAEANRIDYSPDGRWVAWTDIHEKLWRARADGSDKIRLTSNALEVFLAHWAPDGKRLAVMARKPGGVWQIYVVDANGGRAEILVSEERNTADPGWSPDGESIVFGREPELMGKESGSHTLRVIRLANRQIEEIPGSDNLFSPRWSPDGHWIMALTLDQRNVMLYDLAHRQWRKLLSTSAADPVWSSDSKAIYLHAFSADREPILKVEVPSGRVQTVADLGSFPDGEVANYFFGGVTPAGAPLVQPRVGTGNLYALDLPKP